MDKTEILHINKEDSVFAKGQRGYLVFPNESLVPGEVTEAEDSFELALDTEGLFPFSDILAGEGVERYRLLIGCARLEKLRKEYSFPMDPANLAYDVNFLPKAKLRDGARDGGPAFIAEYKALIAAVLAPAYKYEDYLKGGCDLYRKNKVTADIAPMQAAGEIAGRLRAAYDELSGKLAKDSMLVGKKKYKARGAAMIVFIVLFAGLAGLAAKYWAVDIPDMRTQVAVSGSFLAGDYIGVLDAVRGKDLAGLSREERYMAAYAGAQASSLSNSQKAAVQRGLSLNTDSLFLEYWVEMGRGNYENAIDISKRIGDKELELYGLLIYKDAIDTGVSMGGAEKAELLKDLGGQIDALEKEASPDES
ncbi:MAG: hypothetical protein LBS91_07195 [Clostridiales Family XIII bacterium]|jgi:uncharacterized membrane protein YukC|nr:hypothetical protein [Clostridiales Family XIII bacterium]